MPELENLHIFLKIERKKLQMTKLFTEFQDSVHQTVEQ